MKKTPLWHILGFGSIGRLFACKLQKAGITVASITRNNTADAGDIDYEFVEDGTTVPVTIATDNTTPIHFLLLTTKAQQSLDAIASVRHRLHHDAIIVVLQNGMGVQECLQQQLPDARILAASTTEGANRPTPSQLVHAGRGSTWIGPWQARDAALAQRIVNTWSVADMQIEYDAGIRQRLWEKLVMNCAINPLTALFDCRNGELADNGERQALMEAVTRETVAVMLAEGFLVDTDVMVERVVAVAKLTSHNVSSMCTDVRLRRSTEIAFINGYVIKRAALHGLPCPLNRQLHDAIVAQHRLP